jgi:aromatic-L-amino-acid/L-tryptophan decarboxylase
MAQDDSLLEPDDWAAFRKEAHRALDIALDFAARRSQEPVWQEIPDAIKTLDDPMPESGAPLSEVVTHVRDSILPHTLGNTHPRFWGWVNGSGTPSGIVAQLLTGAINANMGGRDHAPIYIERQVVQWMRTLFGYPDSASGLICTGTSSATLLGLSIARFRVLGQAVRDKGNSSEPLRAYCSAQAHVSVQKAMELLGMGSDSLRLVPVRKDFSMDCQALAQMVDEDLAAGMRPFAIVSSVGSVNTGAIDDLVAINRLCSEQGLWHHVDGAFGALIVLSEKLKSRLQGIEHADSIAFDYHKWMHVTYSAACLLVRDGDLHQQAFSTTHPYLRGENKGAAGGAPWPNDFGIDLSRGFAALGVWMQLKEMGTRRLGEAIERNCDQATWLGRQVLEAAELELLAPVSLNIVCFRYAPAGLSTEQLNRLNRHLVVELHCRGIAVPSFTQLDGRTAIRVCIANHRTRQSDLQALLEAVGSLGPELLASGAESEAFELTRR